MGKRTKISSAVRDWVLSVAAATSAGRGARGWSRNGFRDRGREEGIGSSKGDVGVVGKEVSRWPGEVARKLRNGLLEARLSLLLSLLLPLKDRLGAWEAGCCPIGDGISWSHGQLQAR